eukprot:gene21820-24742_t
MRLLEVSRMLQLTLPNVLQINREQSSADPAMYVSNLIIVGDVHGQYEDFAFMFQNLDMGGYPSSQNQYIFNGDMVDRGPMGVEIVVVLLVCKLLRPESIHILRGNHETREQTDYYGFQTEVLKKYDTEVYEQFQSFFNSLPIAAVVENSIFVTHGGIGPEVQHFTIGEINQLDRMGEVREGPIYDLLWPDPCDRRTGTSGFGRPLFGADVTQAFLARNNLTLLIRSHQDIPEGFKQSHNGLCLTVFSAPSNRRFKPNKAALVKFTQENSMEATVIIFNAGHMICETLRVPLPAFA